MKKVLICLIINILYIFCSTASFADSSDDRILQLDEMTNDELMSSVDYGKQAPLIKKFQQREANRLYNDHFNPKKNGCNVETTHQGEILIITISSDLLFIPNEITLLNSCDLYLNPIKRYLKSPDMYRVLLVMHTDDTGIEEYTDNLSLSRVEEIFDWFSLNNCDTKFLFPTASGASEPLPNTPNISAENRAKNRRLEIYLIPGEKMVKAAQKGKIAF